MPAGRFTVEPPALAPRRFGLLAAANVVTNPDLHFEQGISWVGNPCPTNMTARDLCSPAAPITEFATLLSGTYMPFEVAAPVSCSTMSRLDLPARARLALNLHQGGQIEDEFWSGALEQVGAYNNFFLADAGSTTPLGTTSTEPRAALAALEACIYENGGVGRALIHVPIEVVPWLAWYQLVERDASGFLVTPLGSVIVPGTGYDGTDGPEANAGTLTAPYIFATGGVDVYLGPIEVVGPNGPSVTVDNLETVIARRAVAITVDTCAWCAVRINLV